MTTTRRCLSLLILSLFTPFATAELPPAPTHWADWSMAESPDDPGVMSAESLLDQPAAKRGPVVVRDGHFFTGDRRLRLWGVNIAFGANFPTHEQADALARRFARFGINAVRFHHMDNQPFPNGIFADASLETLSPAALDRLDYFVAALKARGVYADLNLHVSRNYNHYHKTADGRDGPRIDKMVDLFDPELIAAQKKYAADLLGHVNAYTHNAYAVEPAVAIVEINNENSLFMWNADRSLAMLPEPYGQELQKQWNRWLAAKYPTRDKLAAVWNAGLKPAGPNLLRDPQFASIGRDWIVEMHDSAKMTVSVMTGSGDPDRHAVKLQVTRVDGTAWHLQFHQANLAIAKGERYTVSFAVRADHPMKITTGVSQAHDPWQAIGLHKTITAGKDWKPCEFGFTSPITDDNARLTFMVGQDIGTVEIADVSLHIGGGAGLGANEDPANGTVKSPDETGFDIRARADDWYDFLQQTDEKYFVNMMNFLKTDVGVKCPITGTIGFGPMEVLTQSKMDFVDAHAYWQHPSFPHREWDMSDWVIANQPMVDDPEHAVLWGLAATRVAGKPFTVTEYQHPAPNDWQAECIPLIASYAARQDWDGLFLFAYSHNSDYQKDKIASFFDIEGNPTKMPLMPMGARLFFGGETKTIADITPLSHEQLLAGVPKYSYEQGRFLQDVTGVSWQEMLANPIAVTFGPSVRKKNVGGSVSWTAHGAGSGRYVDADEKSAVFVGFADGAMPVNLGNSGVRIESMNTPFATIMLEPSEAGKTIAQSDQLLLTAVARAQNSGMEWTRDRRSIGNHWGNPPVQIEVVTATISLPGHWRHAFALDPAGQPTTVDIAKPDGDRTLLQLGQSPALAYQIVR